MFFFSLSRCQKRKEYTKQSFVKLTQSIPIEMCMFHLRENNDSTFRAVIPVK